MRLRHSQPSDTRSAAISQAVKIPLIACLYLATSWMRDMDGRPRTRAANCSWILAIIQAAAAQSSHPNGKPAQVARTSHASIENHHVRVQLSPLDSPGPSVGLGEGHDGAPASFQLGVEDEGCAGDSGEEGGCQQREKSESNWRRSVASYQQLPLASCADFWWPKLGPAEPCSLVQRSLAQHSFEATLRLCEQRTSAD